jgi:hypothetical protein
MEGMLQPITHTSQATSQSLTGATGKSNTVLGLGLGLVPHLARRRPKRHDEHAVRLGFDAADDVAASHARGDLVVRQRLGDRAQAERGEEIRGRRGPAADELVGVRAEQQGPKETQ